MATNPSQDLPNPVVPGDATDRIFELTDKGYFKYPPSQELLRELNRTRSNKIVLVQGGRYRALLVTDPDPRRRAASAWTLREAWQLNATTDDIQIIADLPELTGIDMEMGGALPEDGASKEVTEGALTPGLYALVGIPGSGKSTLARKLARDNDALIINYAEAFDFDEAGKPIQYTTDRTLARTTPDAQLSVFSVEELLHQVVTTAAIVAQGGKAVVIDSLTRMLFGMGGQLGPGGVSRSFGTLLATLSTLATITDTVLIAVFNPLSRDTQGREGVSAPMLDLLTASTAGIILTRAPGAWLTSLRSRQGRAWVLQTSALAPGADPIPQTQQPAAILPKVAADMGMESLLMLFPGGIPASDTDEDI
jgi:hypothetical protein